MSAAGAAAVTAALTAVMATNRYNYDYGSGGRFGRSQGQRSVTDTSYSRATTSTTCTSSIRYRDANGQFWTVSS